VDDYNKRGVPLVAHALTAPLYLRCCFGEKWTFFDNVDVWREALMGSYEERIARLSDPARRQQMKQIYDQTRQPRSVGDILHFICRKISREDLRARYQDRTAAGSAGHFRSGWLEDAVADPGIQFAARSLPRDAGASGSRRFLRRGRTCEIPNTRNVPDRLALTGGA